MGQRHGHALCRRKAVLPVENHAVAAVEHYDRGAGALVFALMHHQVRISHFNGDFHAFAPHGVEERPADIQVQGVAKFVWAGNAARLDAGCQVARVVPPKAASPERSEQVLERFESQKIDSLVRDFKARFRSVLRLANLPARRGVRRRSYLRRLAWINETLVGEALR